jgi:hypothetical protein
MDRFKWVLVIGLLVVIAGGGAAAVYFRHPDNDESKAVVVPLDDIPATLVKTAKDKLPDVEFDHARKLPNGDFEIRGKQQNGKVREVEMKPSGEIIGVE